MGRGSNQADIHFGRKNYIKQLVKVKKSFYILPPKSFPFKEMTPAPTQTIIKTISNSKVLSEALVAELKITASIRQNTKGPHKSPKKKS